jgi:phenylalanyl-tRNA synthetase beta chain
VGKSEATDWQGPTVAYTWQDAIAYAQDILQLCNLNWEIKRSDFAPWHPGRCAELLMNGEVVGTAGEVHPRVVEALGLASRTCAWELNLGVLMAAAPATRTAPRVGTQPVAKEDLALVVRQR